VWSTDSLVNIGKLSDGVQQTEMVQEKSQKRLLQSQEYDSVLG